MLEVSPTVPKDESWLTFFQGGIQRRVILYAFVVIEFLISVIIFLLFEIYIWLLFKCFLK